MTWFGNSFSNLKDQITTLTREVLSEADEDQEQARFIPVEKFNHLLKICEEKEEQICQLQLEVDTLRGQFSNGETDNLRTVKEENKNEADRQCESCVHPKNCIENTVVEESTKECELKKLQIKANTFSVEGGTDVNESIKDHASTILQRIENVKDNADPYESDKILKTVKCSYEAEEQQKHASCNVARLTDPKLAENQAVFYLGARVFEHSSEETMSNDSVRSDDSFFNDFEVLKRKETSKTLDEFHLPNTQSTRSTSTQSEYEFSVCNIGTQTNRTRDDATGEKFCESEAVLDHCVNVDSELTEDEFWEKVDDLELRNTESLTRHVSALIAENRYWKQLWRSASEGAECDDQITKLMGRESSLEQSTKLKDTNIAEHVDHSNMYSKNSSLNEVSDEVVDQTVELDSLYKELKSLTEAKELLYEENTALKAGALAQIEESERNTAPVSGELVGQNIYDSKVIDDLNASISRLRLENEHIRQERTKVDQLSSATREQLNKSQRVVAILQEQLQLGRQTEINGDYQQHQNELSSLRSEVEELRNLLIHKLNECEDEVARWIENYIELQNKCSAELERISNVEKQCRNYEGQLYHSNEVRDNKERECQRFLHVFELMYVSAVDSLLQHEHDICELTRSACSATQFKHCPADDKHSAGDPLADHHHHHHHHQQQQQQQPAYSNNMFSQQVHSLEELIANLADMKERFLTDLRHLKCQFVLHDENMQTSSSVEPECIHLMQNEMKHLQEKLNHSEIAHQRLESDLKMKMAERDLSNEIVKTLRNEIELLTKEVEVVIEKKTVSKRAIMQYISSLLMCANEDESRIRRLISSALSEMGRFLHFDSIELEQWHLFERLLLTKKETNANELESAIEKRDTFICQLQAQIFELQQSMASRDTDAVHLNNVVSELQTKLGSLISERDQVIASLKEKHAENLFYHSEIQKMHALYVAEHEKYNINAKLVDELKQKSSEDQNATMEVERLRHHLLAIEQSYTNELLSTEEQIKELKWKVKDYEERIQLLNATRTSVNVRANTMSESLQKEVQKLTQEKDQLLSNLNTSQSELKKVVNDVQKLRSALDLFHRNKDSEVFQATEKYRDDIRKLENDNASLNETVRLLQNKMEAMKRMANEKQQMHEEVQLKKGTIDKLEKEVDVLQSNVNQLKKRTTELEANAENKLKIDLLKNIFLRYLSSDTDSMKAQALHILSEVLDFSAEEKYKFRFRFQGELKHIGSTSSPNNSLIDEFIRFVEKESDPREKKNPQRKDISSNILFSSPSLPDVMLPALSQHPVGHNSGYILKDVLQ